jgi:hypothetical protein
MPCVHVKVVKALNSCGFTDILVDLCLWVKQSNSAIVMMSIYVGNYLAIGYDDGIKGVIQDWERYDFVLKIEKYLKDYLSCRIKIDKQDRIAWSLQLHLIKIQKPIF